MNVFKQQIQDRIEVLKIVKSKPLIGSSRDTDTDASNANKSILSRNDSIDVKILKYIINEIKMSFVKNVNINIDSLKSSKNFKIPFIDKDKISHLEHSLQLLTIGTGTNQDIKLKNEYLTQLNSLYYTELMSTHNCLSDIIRVLKDDSFDSNAGDEESRDDTMIDFQNETIGQLQKRVNSLERDKMQMELQIIKLKERWNGLVESARKRRESQSKEND